MKILLLAGSGEARQLASRLHAQGHDVTASLAGATREALKYDCPTRTGGFGGAEAFESYLKAQGFEAVIDATHPFAARISARSCESCETLKLPYLQLMRPEWRPRDGDNWHMVTGANQACELIQSRSRVFLATGRQTLRSFENLRSCYLICRQIDPPDGPFPFPNGMFLVGRPPFSVSDERALFDQLRIDVLVVKNAGGDGSRSKLDAARQLNIPVIMIARPPALDAEIVETVEQALEWLGRHADH